jgi:hypothetical protein
VLAGGRGKEGCQQAIDLADRAAAHDRDGALELMVQMGKHRWKGGRNHDQLRRGSDLEQSAVEIEKQRRFPVEVRRCHSASSPCALIRVLTRRVLG